MIELRVTETHLELIPDDSEALEDASTLNEALEYHLANGWDIVDPSEVGALTDGTIISQEVQRNDDGEIQNIGTIYWDKQYETVDTLAELKAGKTVKWIKA